MKQQICTLDQVPPEGQAREFPFFGREVQVWRTGGTVRAAANTCLHLGGPLECRDGEFVCPWHGARFDMETGRKTHGPGPEGARLMVLPTRVEDGALVYVWEER